MTAAKTPRVLLVAEHASAKFGGEAILPLHYFRELRKLGVDARLITHQRTRDELLALFPNDHDRIHFTPDTWLQRKLSKAVPWAPPAIRYFTVRLAARMLNQRTTRRLARKLVREHAIHVVHQPIPVSPKEVSMMHGVGAPVVIGPMNGGMKLPRDFGRTRSPLANAFVRVGRRLSALANFLVPGKRRAAALLVANERTRKALPGKTSGFVATLVENGVDSSKWRYDESASANRGGGG
jgi:hypothetical protein